MSDQEQAERGSDPFGITGKRTLITGGTAGIGLGVARHFVRAGAEVVISGRRAAGADIAESIGARFVTMDVADEASVQHGTDVAAEILGGLDVVIQNAGIGRPCGPLDQLDLGVFREILEVNLFGVVRGMRYALPHMGRGGVILVTSSPGGRQALAAPGMIGYSCSKAAVDMVIRSAGLELAAKGIRVSGVLPGLIRTEIAGEHGVDDSWLAALTASGHAQDPEAIAPVFHFLASEAGAMTQGSIVAADDGCSAGLSATVLERLMRS